MEDYNKAAIASILIPLAVFALAMLVIWIVR